MKELFTSFFNITISGSIMILAAILLRTIFRKAPKAVLCLLWGLIFLRFLIPVQIETGFSLRPETPVLSAVDTSIIEQETSFGFQPSSWDEENTLVSEIPSFIPQQKLSPQDVVVDYVYIGALLWAVGFVGMLIYTVATYLRLRLRLREAVRLEKNVFECSRIDSPFLLGFFRPRIYLPVHMDEGSRSVVIAHEQAHLRRGDNWFKLIAFICLALHCIIRWSGSPTACCAEMLKVLAMRQLSEIWMSRGERTILLHCSIAKNAEALLPDAPLLLARSVSASAS